MNENKPDVVLDDMTLDRLVDGELSPAEYRRVLLALEQHPAGWRKCAEAFLQAQAWQREMKDMRAAAEIKPAAQPKAEPTPRSNATNDWLRMLLVAAASFLFAFFVARQSWRALERSGTSGLNEQFAESPQAAPQPATNPPAYSQQQAIATNAVNHQPLGKVQLAVNRTGSEEPQVVDVSIYDPQTATELLSNSRPALPDDLLAALEAEGHRIDRQPRLVPVQLDDGRQMIVPVEGYRIVPVSRPSY